MDPAVLIGEAAAAAGDTSAGGTLMKQLPLLIVNGATLLVVAVMLIRRSAKTEERLINGITFAITGLKDELIGLRRDIRDTSTANAVAIGALTDRVSRIEGKIEGIAFSRAPEMADSSQEVTGVNHRLPHPDDVFDGPTPVHGTQTSTKRTPPVGVPRAPTGGYGPGRPPRTKP